MSKSIDRRAALKKVSLMMGGVAMTPALLGVLQSCENAKEVLDWTPLFFDEDQAKVVAAIAEHIIPKTDTPGAREVGVHIFIDSFIKNCVPADKQNIIPDGLARVDAAAQSQYQKKFLKTSQEEQVGILSAIAEEDYTDELNEEGINGQKALSYFQVMKQLTLLGYFTSERGASEALALLEIPGDYEPCMDLQDGQKAWALR